MIFFSILALNFRCNAVGNTEIRIFPIFAVIDSINWLKLWNFYLLNLFFFHGSYIHEIVIVIFCMFFNERDTVLQIVVGFIIDFLFTTLLV